MLSSIAGKDFQTTEIEFSEIGKPTWYISSPRAEHWNSEKDAAKSAEKAYITMQTDNRKGNVLWMNIKF